MSQKYSSRFKTSLNEQFSKKDGIASGKASWKVQVAGVKIIKKQHKDYQVTLKNSNERLS